MSLTTWTNLNFGVGMTGQATQGIAPITGQTSLNCVQSKNFVFGSGAGNYNRVYSVAFSVTAGAPLAIDLTNLTDVNGQAINATNLQAYSIKTDDGNTDNVTIGGGANPVLAAEATPIKAGAGRGSIFANLGTVAPADGITVDATHKVFTITAAAGTQTGQVAFLLKQ